MAIVTPFDTVQSTDIRGRVGRPNELGETWCGWSELGEYMPIAGIYQRRTRYGKKQIVRMKHYHGVNPQTVPQQANRSKFAEAVTAWQALSASERKQWRALKYPRYMSGYNRFIREYMRGFVSN